jgi:hypothetical protein
MTVIEVEGTNVQPLPIDAVEVFAGTCIPSRVLALLIKHQRRSTLLGCCKMILSALV